MDHKDEYTNAGVILLSKDKILVVQGITTGKWSFPKGHREDGEDIYTTATREMKEETGVNLTDTDKYIATYTYTYNYGDGNKIYKYLIYKTDRYIKPIIGDPQEIKDVRWVHISSLADDRRYDKNRSLSDYVRAQLKRKATLDCNFGDKCYNKSKCIYKHS